ncbi:RRM domain-containing protein [Citrus sinensis]|nr:RRM domain-containing protein [Citrus sinensis]
MAGAGIHTYHQQWPPAPAPPPPPAAAAAAPPPPPPVPYDNTNRIAHDEVRTIFITGLPDDVKERELQNLLRWLPGYEASQVNYKGEKPMGFALFSTAQLAVAAKDALQEMIFDAETKSVLHTEMAKKNLFVKRGIVADTNAYDQSKRLRTGGDYTHTGYSAPSPFHAPPAPVWGPHGYMAPPPPPYDPYGGYGVPPVQMPAPAPVPAPSSYVPVQGFQRMWINRVGHGGVISNLNKRQSVAQQSATIHHFLKLDAISAIYVNDPDNAASDKPVNARIAKFLNSISIFCLTFLQNTKDNPPCNTLFIGNLGESINEEELRGLFSAQPGFKQMKVLRQERHTVCFIEFEDVNSASSVHHNLQGAVIPSSGSVGMRIQYPFRCFCRS